MICFVRALCLVLFSAGSSFGQANPTQADVSHSRETTQHTYGPFTLKAQSLQQMPEPEEVIFPEDDVWLVGYHTEIVDGSGNRLSRELQCHTFLGSSNPHNLPDDFALGLFSDGYTEGIQRKASNCPQVSAFSSKPASVSRGPRCLITGIRCP